MSPGPRVVVVGGGTMGLASALELSRRGARVTVLEATPAPHSGGSHSGHTRVIRHAYHEGSNYVPLVREADDAWCALEGETGRSLLVRTGLLEFGGPDDPDFAAALAACDAHAIPYERLTAQTVNERWPFQIPRDWTASFTPSGGYLRVGACFTAMRQAAIARGAVFREGVPDALVSRVVIGRQPVVELSDGTAIKPDAVVIAAGVRTPALLGKASPPSVRPIRRALFWMALPQPVPAKFSALPVWAAFTPEGFFYGFPPGDEGAEGLKVACHTATQNPVMDRTVDPETLERTIGPADWRPVSEFLDAHMPEAGSLSMASSCVCMYGVTPDWHFIVDRHPESSAVVVATGFSGHGFKFAPAIGKRVAELALGDSPPIEAFRYR